MPDSDPQEEDFLSSSTRRWLQQNYGILEVQFSPVGPVKRCSNCVHGRSQCRSALVWWHHSFYEVDTRSDGILENRDWSSRCGSGQCDCKFSCWSWSEGKVMYVRTKNTNIVSLCILYTIWYLFLLCFTIAGLGPAVTYITRHFEKKWLVWSPNDLVGDF